MSYRPTKNFSLLNRSSIFARYPWVNQRNLKMVVGTDLDATMSSVLAHHVMGWEIVGFYDLATMYRKKGVTDVDFYGAIWLDLDISFPNIKSIGHHVLRIDEKPLKGRQQQALNPNLLQGITHQYYGQKYPLATIHFLLWLWGVNPSVTNALALPLYWLPDSTFISGQSNKMDAKGNIIQKHHRKNVLDWLTHCVPISALNATTGDIETLAFEQRVKVLLHEFTQCGWHHYTKETRPNRLSNHLKIAGGQCTFSRPDPVRLNALYQFIASVTGWSAPVCPIEFDAYKGNYDRILVADIEPLNNLGLAKFLDNNVFSYAITEFKWIKYTSEPFESLLSNES